MIIRQTALIEVRRTKTKGRGVFAAEFIAEGTVFERAPVLVMPAHEVLTEGDETLLSHYLFEWGRKTVAMALGFGSLYNHSYTPNARYEDEGRHIKLYIAVRDIQAGEEITINYNGDATSTEPVWFDVVEDHSNRLEPAATADKEKSVSSKATREKNTREKNTREKNPVPKRTTTAKSSLQSDVAATNAGRKSNSKAKARRATT